MSHLLLCLNVKAYSTADKGDADSASDGCTHYSNNSCNPGDLAVIVDNALVKVRNS